MNQPQDNLQHIPFSERYLTTEEAADFLKHSINTLNKWRSLGYGPEFIKIGRSVRYKVADLQAFMEKHRRAFIDGLAPVVELKH